MINIKMAIMATGVMVGYTEVMDMVTDTPLEEVAAGITAAIILPAIKLTTGIQKNTRKTRMKPGTKF